MVAELYIIAESFAYNADFSKEQVEEKVKGLSKDFIEIRKHQPFNRIFVHPDIYNIPFVQNIPLSTLLFDPIESKKIIDRDVYNALQKIIVESAITSITSEEVISVLLPEHNENICHGLIAFHAIPGIDEHLQIVYNISDWYRFRRYFLGLYPKNPSHFIEECNIYFPGLFFHEENKNSIGSILGECPRKIIYHLSALNDNFKRFYTFPYNRTIALKEFSIYSNLDEAASPEGNPERKLELTFKFLNDAGILEDVYCEPHMKLCFTDNYPGDRSYSTDRRIYFHEGKANIHENKILVGHIGRHL